MQAIRGVAVLAFVALAGCSFSSASTSVGHSGDTPWSSAKSGGITCGGDARLSGFVEHEAGAIMVIVKDGDDETVFGVTISRDSDIEKDLDGAGGEWALAVTGDGFVGAFDLELAC